MISVVFILIYCFGCLSPFIAFFIFALIERIKERRLKK